MDQERVRCPRCGGLSWFERDVNVLVQRCLCGLTKQLLRVVGGEITVMHAAATGSDITLPAKGTKIGKCLNAVRDAHPQKVTTGAVATAAELNNKETASLLITLMGRGLIERVSERRGLVGGSEWKLTVVAKGLLKV